jgi:hypothetical protein
MKFRTLALGLSTALVVIGGSSTLALAGKPRSVEAIPVPVSNGLKVESLTGEEAKTGEQLAAERLAELVARYPELRGATLGKSGPVYPEKGDRPIGVSTQIDLPAPVDVTLDLLYSGRDSSGTLVVKPQTAQITNLRGLTMSVDLKTGVVTDLYTTPFMDDVNRPETMTQVELINPDQFLPPNKANEEGHDE